MCDGRRLGRQWLGSISLANGKLKTSGTGARGTVGKESLEKVCTERAECGLPTKDVRAAPHRPFCQEPKAV